jgi:hypothetical protein
MEIIQGIAGVVGLGVFAALLGFDVRDIAGLRAKPDDTVLMYDDPNSTMGVTRDVLAEKLEQLQPESRAYSQNWSKA